MIFFNQTKGTVLADAAEVADSFFGRFCGLMLKPPLATGQGLYLAPCNAIHMFFMRFAIDAVFLDKDGKVVGLVENLKPGRLSPVFSQAHACLELPAGTISSTATAIGDVLIQK